MLSRATALRCCLAQRSLRCCLWRRGDPTCACVPVRDASVCAIVAATAGRLTSDDNCAERGRSSAARAVARKPAATTSGRTPASDEALCQIFAKPRIHRAFNLFGAQ
jgi:hypothetical protein